MKNDLIIARGMVALLSILVAIHNAAEGDVLMAWGFALMAALWAVNTVQTILMRD